VPGKYFILYLYKISISIVNDDQNLQRMKLEKKHQQLLPVNKFIKRQIIFAAVSFALIIGSICIGTFGYVYFGNLSRIDGFYNASMILTGMGPVDRIDTNGGKLFASFYALFSGVAFLSTIAVLFTPIIHRLMHMMHIEESAGSED
jgi:hypothetical protein